MNKKFKALGLALLAVSMTGITAFAQDTNTGSTTCTPTVQQCGRQNKAGKANDGRKTKDCSLNAFEGITLTDAQQAQLQQLNEKRAQQRKQSAQAGKADRQQRESAMRNARKTSKKEYLEEVKAILGPDQYVVFLENMVVNAPDGQRKAHGNHAKLNKKSGRNMNFSKSDS